MSDVFTPNSSIHQQANTAGVAGPSSPRSTPPMPNHMRLDEWPLPYPLSALFQCIFTGLCILFYGRTTLEDIWNATVEDGEMWTREKMRMATRLGQNNVIGGLFLATLAGWLTSSPPAGMILDYTTRGPYVCLLASSALILGSVIVGSAVLYAMPVATGTWFHMTLMENRICVCGTLLMITYPFLSMAAGASVVIIASFSAQDGLVRVGCISLVLLPNTFAWFFIWSQVRHLSVFAWRNEEQELADKT